MIGKNVTIAVKIIPKANRNEILGWQNEELRVRIAAIPEKGNANEELIRFLARVLDLAKSCVQIIHGETSRHKRIAILGLAHEVIMERLKLHASSSKKD